MKCRLRDGGDGGYPAGASPAKDSDSFAGKSVRNEAKAQILQDSRGHARCPNVHLTTRTPLFYYKGTTLLFPENVRFSYENKS